MPRPRGRTPGSESPAAQAAIGTRANPRPTRGSGAATTRGISPWVFGLLIVVRAGDPHLPRVRQAAAVVEPRLRAPRDVRERRDPARDRTGADRGRERRQGHRRVRRGRSRHVTFTVDEDGQPIHEDAEVEIRPRLFLEGNFFVDLVPGSPSAPELDDGGQIPFTQTSTAVQLDEVLTALQAPTRKGLQKTLEGFGTALNYEPTAGRRPRPRTPTSPARPRASRSTTPSPTARRPGAARRSSPRRCAARTRAISPASSPRPGRVFAKLASRGDDLGELITNFNVVAGALADESENLSRDDPRARADARGGERLAREPQRGAAAIARAGDRLAPGNPGAAGDDRRLRAVAASRPANSLQPAELGGLARLLRSTAPGLAQVNRGAKDLFPETTALSRCSIENPGPDGRHRDHRRRALVRWPAELLRILLRPGQSGRRRAELRRQRPLPAGPAGRRPGARPHPKPDRPAVRPGQLHQHDRGPGRDPAGAAIVEPAVPDGRALRTTTCFPTSMGPRRRPARLT